MRAITSSERNELIAQLQDLLTDGLVCVVGSGYSVGHGLPGMPELSNHLVDTIPPQVSGNDATQWEAVQSLIEEGKGLEPALHSAHVSDTLLNSITETTAKFMDSAEHRALAEIASGDNQGTFGHFADHFLKSSRILHVVTPNYDRIIEHEVEIAGIGVDTGYVGTYVGVQDAMRSALSYREYVQDGRRVRLIVYPHVRLYKPHGSLDWYVVGNRVIRSAQCLEEPRAIIAPGGTKYRDGYQEHFDVQRTAAADRLGKTNRVLAIGYGFNDDQLEHRWCPGLTTDKHVVLMTKVLTENALQLLMQNESVLALYEGRVDERKVTVVHRGGQEPAWLPEDMWTLAGYCKEVIGNA
ncbi:MAG: SIR2 family protein [Armatimonadetes bacterium]|nr:SIR2 family protein [Armatimonadota bacterium]